MPISWPPGRCGRRRAAERGFTLLELLAVLAVISIAVLAALPYLPGRAEAASVRAAADSIANGLRESRGLAIRQKAPVLFTLDVAERRWTVEGGGSDALPGDVELALETDRRLLSSAEVGAVGFFADGSATGGRIAVRRGGVGVTVTIDWLTGAVAIDG
jgi:general secretion pathway protein H